MAWKQPSQYGKICSRSKGLAAVHGLKAVVFWDDLPLWSATRPNAFRHFAQLRVVHSCSDVNGTHRAQADFHLDCKSLLQKVNSSTIPPVTMFPDIWKFGMRKFQKFHKLFRIATGHIQANDLNLKHNFSSLPDNSAHFLNSQLNAAHIVDYCGQEFLVIQSIVLMNCCEPEMLCHNHCHFIRPYGVCVDHSNRNPWVGLLRFSYCVTECLRSTSARFLRLLCLSLEVHIYVEHIARLRRGTLQLYYSLDQATFSCGKSRVVEERVLLLLARCFKILSL